MTTSEMEEDYVANVQYPYRYFDTSQRNPLLYISIIILIAIPLNIIVRKFRIPAGDRVMMLIISCMYIYFYQLKFFFDINFFNYITPIHKLTWLLPLLQFKNIFLLELYIMKKARHEIFIMSIVCNLIVILGTSVSLAKLVLDDTSMLSCILFATTITCVEGCDSFKRVKEMERNKHVLIILEGESLLGTTLFLTAFHVVIRTYGGLLDTWQSQMLFTLQYIGGGIVCGIVVGRISGWLLSLAYNDALNSLVVCLTCIYFFYSISEYILLVSGPVVSFIVSMYLSTARKKLTAESVLFIRNFTEIIMYATNITVFVVICSRLMYMAIYFYPRQKLIYAACSYCFIIVFRMATLLMAYPILCRIGYRMDLPSCTFYGWAGASRGPISLVLAQIAYRNKYSTKSFNAAMPHVLATIILSILINYTTYSFLLKKLGFFTMSTMRKGNMQNCIDYLNGRKWTLLTILKMASGLMTDTNYPIVYKYTIIKNPYRNGGNEDEEDYEDKLINEFGMRESKCPLCSRDITLQPTIKEKKENIQEASLRLLKSQKMAFIRQYELGMLSKDAIRFLLHLVEAAMESNDLIIKLDEFYRIFYIKDFYNYMKVVAELMYGMETIRVPREKLRRRCYKIVTHFGFECFMFILIIVVTMPFVMRHLSTQIYYRIKIWIIWSSFFVLVIFLLEIMLKIYAFSSDGRWEGLRTYFRSKWNILDFAVVSVHMVVTCIGGYNRWYIDDVDHMRKSAFRMVAVNFNDGFKLLRLFRILRFVSASCIAKCNHKINSRISFGYDIGKVIIITFSDLAESLYQITENQDIISILKNQLETSRDAVNITLEDVVKLKPSVPVQVKTKQAIRSTLNHMRFIVIELKNLGHVDNLEFEQIMGRLYERNRAIKTLHKIKPSSPKTRFMELSFMISDDGISEILFSQVEIVNWDTNAIVVKDSDDALGMFVLLQGVLRITYIPNQEVVDDLINFGILPIVDFVSPFRADVLTEEFIFPGNSFGELAVLTQRKYNCRIQADSKSRAIFLNATKMQDAMKISCDPIKGLAARLWKYVMMECATAILRTSQGYHNSSLDQIRMTIDRSFVPDLQHFRTFIVTDLMEDLLLLEGLVADANNGDVYVAPCYLPRTVQKLIFYDDPSIKMEVKVKPKLLIIPMKDVDEYEIMERVEDMVELIDNPPNYLLVHKYRKMKVKKNKKGGGGGGGLIGLSKRRRQIDFSTMQARSRTLSQASTTKSEPPMSVKGSGDTESDQTSHESGSSETDGRATYQMSPIDTQSEEYNDGKNNGLKITKISVGNIIAQPLVDKPVEDTAKETVESYLSQLIENVCPKIEDSTLHQIYDGGLDVAAKSMSKQVQLDENVRLDDVLKHDSNKSEVNVHFDHAFQAKERQIGKHPIIHAKKIDDAKNTGDRQASNETQIITTEDYIQSIINDLLKNKVVPEVITDIELSKSEDKLNVPVIKVEEFSKVVPDHLAEEAIMVSPLPTKEDIRTNIELSKSEDKLNVPVIEVEEFSQVVADHLAEEAIRESPLPAKEDIRTNIELSKSEDKLNVPVIEVEEFSQVVADHLAEEAIRESPLPTKEDIRTNIELSKSEDKLNVPVIEVEEFSQVVADHLAEEAIRESPLPTKEDIRTNIELSKSEDKLNVPVIEVEEFSQVVAEHLAEEAIRESPLPTKEDIRTNIELSKSEDKLNVPVIKVEEFSKVVPDHLAEEAIMVSPLPTKEDIRTNIELSKSEDKLNVPVIEVEEFSQVVADHLAEEAIRESPLPAKEDISTLVHPEEKVDDLKQISIQRIKTLSDTIQEVEGIKIEIVSVEEQVDIPESGTKLDGAVDEFKIKDKRRSKRSEQKAHRLSKDHQTTSKSIDEFIATVEDDLHPHIIKVESITLEDNHENVIFGIEDSSDVKNAEEVEQKQITEVVYPAILESENKFVVDLDNRGVKDKRRSKDPYIPKDATKPERTARRLSKKIPKKTKPKDNIKHVVEEQFQSGQGTPKSIIGSVESVQKVISLNLDEDASKLPVIKEDECDKLQTDDKVIVISKSVSGAAVKEEAARSDQIYVQESEEKVRRSSKVSQKKPTHAPKIKGIEEKYIIQPDHIPVKLKKASVEVEAEMRSSKERQVVPIVSSKLAKKQKNTETIRTKEPKHAKNKDFKPPIRKAIGRNITEVNEVTKKEKEAATETKSAESDSKIIDVATEQENAKAGMVEVMKAKTIAEEDHISKQRENTQRYFQKRKQQRDSDRIETTRRGLHGPSYKVNISEKKAFSTDPKAQATNQTNHIGIKDATGISAELSEHTISIFSRDEQIQFPETKNLSTISHMDEELIDMLSPQGSKAKADIKPTSYKTSVERDSEIKNDKVRETRMRRELKNVDKEKKRKDKVASRIEKPVQYLENYEVMEDYDIFNLNKTAPREKLSSSHKEHTQIPRNRTSSDETETQSVKSLIKLPDTEATSASKLYQTIRERRKSIPLLAMLFPPVSDDPIAKPEFITDDRARQLYLELTRKRLEEKSNKMKAEKDQKNVPEKQESPGGTADPLVDLDLDRTMFMWKLKDNDVKNYNNQRGIVSPARTEQGNREKTRKQSMDIQEEEKANGSGVDHEVPSTSINTGKYDRSVKEAITQHKKKIKHPDSIKERSSRDNEAKRRTSIVEEQNVKQMLVLDTGRNIETISAAKNDSFPNLHIYKHNIKIVDSDEDGERSAKKGEKRKYPNEISRDGIPSAVHTNKESKEIHFKSLSEHQKKSANKSLDKIRVKRKASIAVPEVNIEIDEPNKEQQFDYKKYFGISNDSLKLNALGTNKVDDITDSILFSQAARKTSPSHKNVESTNRNVTSQSSEEGNTSDTQSGKNIK